MGLGRGRLDTLGLQGWGNECDFDIIVRVNASCDVSYICKGSWEMACLADPPRYVMCSDYSGEASVFERHIA